ncbi:radical SAM protein [candidate division KSB1 bacterium]|nr:radical SAM protein [candidate division KSB1 bacterium]
MALARIEFRRLVEDLLRSEQNRVTCNPGANYRIALVYPNRYAIAVANLGFQEVYRLFNAEAAFSCERSFAYEPPFNHFPLTLETQRELNTFDIIAFSLSFELDELNLAQLLHNAKIPIMRSERDENSPLIIAGGIVASLNPAPLTNIVDVFLLGEAEVTIPQFCTKITAHRPGELRSEKCLQDLAELDFCFVPGFTSTHAIIQKASVTGKAFEPVCSSIISPHSHFQNMFCVEVGRACGRGCRFCAAGHACRPIRFHPPENVIAAVRNNPFQAKKIGLIGAALSDYPRLDHVCSTLIDEGYTLGLSSFRMDVITPKFLSHLENANVRSITLAPEAGSERMRKLIHKNLSDEQIYQAIEYLAYSAISNIKLYFMIGLPFENSDDIEAIAKMVQKISSKLTGREINVSINAFIPKPFTPFQWAPMDRANSIKRKRNSLYSRLRKIKGVTVSQKSLRSEIMQAVLSLGDSRLGAALARNTAGSANWQTILKQSGIDLDQVIHQTRQYEDKLPWDFIAGGISKEWLWQDWQSAKALG